MCRCGPAVAARAGARERGLFPLPGIRPEGLQTTGLSPKARKRIQSRLEDDLRLNESVDALNAWGSGDVKKVFQPGPRSLTCAAEGTRLQQQTLIGLLEDAAIGRAYGDKSIDEVPEGEDT